MNSSKEKEPEINEEEAKGDDFGGIYVDDTLINAIQSSLEKTRFWSLAEDKGLVKNNDHCCCCCCCDHKSGETNGNCFTQFRVTLATRQLTWASRYIYDIEITWQSNASNIRIEYMTTNSQGWQTMWNSFGVPFGQSGWFNGLPNTGRRIWYHPTTFSVVRCNDPILIRGICLDANNNPIGESGLQTIIIPC